MSRGVAEPQMVLLRQQGGHVTYRSAIGVVANLVKVADRPNDMGRRILDTNVRQIRVDIT